MKYRKFVGAAVAALLLGGITVAIAAPSCTGWMRQTDGSYWRTCVSDSGKQYCQVSKNGHISRVRCN